MKISIKINVICAGGNHIHLTATTPKGSKDFEFTKQDFQIEPDEFDEALLILLRSFVKESGLTNWSQIKTAIEAKTFKL